MEGAYFKVGEEVILESKSLPECNGEYTVLEVFPKGHVLKEAEGTVYYCPDIGYAIGALPPAKFFDAWDQSSLRKKHPPSEESFSEMMGKLKDGTLRGVS